MGMIYKGVEYHHAFEFNVPNENGRDRPFDIVISNYRRKNQDFAGMCLNNELKVISIQPIPFAAFFDIVNQLIDITIQSEKAYAEMYPGKPLTPLMTVEDPVFRSQFEECRKSMKSLEWYEKLKKYFEGSENMLEIDQVMKTDLVDAQNLVFFKDQFHREKPQVKVVGHFRLLDDVERFRSMEGLRVYG